VIRSICYMLALSACGPILGPQGEIEREIQEIQNFPRGYEIDRGRWVNVARFGESAGPVLLNYLENSDDEEFKIGIIVTLADIGYKDAYVAIEDQLYSAHKEPYFQSHVLESMVALDSDAALKYVLELSDSENDDVRVVASSSLAHYSDKISCEIASKMIKDQNPRVRLNSAICLAQKKCPDFRLDLNQALKKETDSLVARIIKTLLEDGI